MPSAAPLGPGENGGSNPLYSSLTGLYGISDQLEARYSRPEIAERAKAPAIPSSTPNLTPQSEKSDSRLFSRAKTILSQGKQLKGEVLDFVSKRATHEQLREIAEAKSRGEKYLKELSAHRTEEVTSEDLKARLQEAADFTIGEPLELLVSALLGGGSEESPIYPHDALRIAKTMLAARIPGIINNEKLNDDILAKVVKAFDETYGLIIDEMDLVQEGGDQAIELDWHDGGLFDALHNTTLALRSGGKQITSADYKEVIDSEEVQTALGSLKRQLAQLITKLTNN